ncbi:MAG: GNAT family N-acetyltransferase [Candidatus Dormibacteria bacterium]
MADAADREDDRARLKVEPAAFDSPAVQSLVEAQVRELRSRYTIPGAPPPAPADFVEPTGVFLLGSLEGEPVTCGGIRLLAGSTAEIRRMYTLPSRRQRGLGHQILQQLEVHARRLGYRAIRLETGDRQPEAVALYSRAGYRVIPCYGEFNDVDSICMEKKVWAAG